MPTIPIYFDKETYKRLTEEKERSPLIKTLLHRHWRKQKDNELARNIIQDMLGHSTGENINDEEFNSDYQRGRREVLGDLIKKLS